MLNQVEEVFLALETAPESKMLIDFNDLIETELGISEGLWERIEIGQLHQVNVFLFSVDCCGW